MSGFAGLEYASQTDVGVRRSHNQDSYAVLTASDPEEYRQRGHVFVVADGMGAHAVGELASKLAADAIPHVYGKYADQGPAAALRKAFIEANATIFTRGKQNREFEGMGTTGTALLLRPEGAWIGHVGDSRVYRIRGGVIEQLSFDHSLLWEMARRQKKPPEKITGVPSNVIIRSLGPAADVEVDVDGPYPVEAGDVFLLCSDGLSGQVTDREMGAVVQVLPPADACRFLIDLANMQGGPDNITVVIARVHQDSTAPDSVECMRLAGKPVETGLKPWLRRAPWPLGLLLLGIMLAGWAVFLSYNRVSGEMPAFLLAAVALVGGLLGLMAQNLWESRAPAPPSEPTPPRIHRTTDCVISPQIVDRLAQALDTLEQRVREKGLQAHLDRCADHREHVEQALKKGDLDEAFRHQCQAMLNLMEVVGQHRTKEEAFKPLWDEATA